MGSASVRVGVVVVGVLMGIAGCGDDEGSTSATTGGSATSVEPTVLPPSSSPVGTTAPAGGARVEGAIADLAGRLGVEPSAITVVEEREVTWSDSSLGCPEPDMNYLQQLTDGVLVVLEADGTRYEYHGGDTLAYCADPKPPAAGD